jgi:hypothetical protein
MMGLEEAHSRTALIFGLAAATFIVCGNPAFAQVACPQNISVEQKAAAPNEWSVVYSKASADLSSATIFEGPPEELASLKYDDERNAKDEIIQTWKLPASERGYWIACGYSNTTAELRRKLPNDLRACEVILEKGVTFGDGSAVVKRAECTAAGSQHQPR